MDDLALYHVNFLNYKEPSGILHILQAAILADYYDEQENNFIRGNSNGR